MVGYDRGVVMLSVIIPTRNRADLLRLALVSLQGQTLPEDQFEVLVIDNGSKDGTKEVVREFQQQSGNIHYFHEPTPGLHAGRHLGLKKSTGDVLVYADDDVQAEPNWLSAIAENFSDPSVMLLGGNNYPDFKVDPPEWILQLWQQPFMEGHAISSLSVISLPKGRRDFEPGLVWGCNFSIRKQVLIDAGGFHPDAMPQELIRFRGDGETHVSQFVRAMGMRCVFDSRASVFHAVTPERMTIEYFKQRAYNQGISDSYTRLRGSLNGNSGLARLQKWLINLTVSAKGVVGRLRERGRPNHELRFLNEVMREGYRAGYSYHQMMYQNDQEVRAWVHRQNYFECPV